MRETSSIVKQGSGLWGGSLGKLATVRTEAGGLAWGRCITVEPNEADDTATITYEVVEEWP